MVEIKAPFPISIRDKNNPVIFLAGSIEMGIAEDWQSRIVNECSGKRVTFLNPRRGEWDSSWEQKVENPQFYQQVNWEMNALDKADIIIMYFSPETKSPISLLELGLYASSGKMIVCCPDGFWRKGNVEAVCEKYNIQMVEDVNGLVDFVKSVTIDLTVNEISRNIALEIEKRNEEMYGHKCGHCGLFQEWCRCKKLSY